MSIKTADRTAIRTIDAPAEPTATPTRWGAMMAALRARRDERAALRQLQRDLAVYDTPSAIDDLLAMTERQPAGPDAETVRAILLDNLDRYHHRTAIH